jgi:hypothetical protein
MLGCPLQATYPVVPLADRHALSVGMTTVRDLACFGIYADRETLPHADGLARDIDEALAELLAGANQSNRPSAIRCGDDLHWADTARRGARSADLCGGPDKDLVERHTPRARHGKSNDAGDVLRGDR